MRTLILSTFLYACESWTLSAELERRVQGLEMRCYRRLPNVSYKDHVTNEEVHSRIQNASGEHNHGEETETQMVWLYLKILWYGEGNSAGDSERTWRRGRQEKRYEDNINEWTGIEFGKSLRAAEDREMRNGMFTASSVVPQRPSRLRYWDEMRWKVNSIFSLFVLFISIDLCTTF